MQPGVVVGGKYRIERALARGGMGSLWVARHVQLGSTVAIKFLDAGFAASPAHRARFEREARSAANLKSPHVVGVQDYGFEGGAPYIVMELLEGEDLGQRLHRVRRMNVRDTAKILVQVGKALRKAHEAGIAHRDLKPANLFIARVDDEEVVKILDFGIAKEQHAPLGEATRTGEVIGSPHYMSPEQVHADRDIDHRTDLWSLGIILYRMLVGALPFPGDQLGPVLAKILTAPLPVPSQVAPDLPPSMDAFFARALARDRQHRFQSIGEMIEAFHAAAGGVDALSSISISLGTGQLPAAGGGTVAWNPIGGSGPITGSGPMAGSGPITGSAPMHGPMAGSGPITGVGAIGGSGPITGVGPMGGSGPITGAGHAGPIAGSVTAGGLASTSPPKARSAAPFVAIGAITAVAGAAVLGFLVLRGPSDDAPAAAAQPTAPAASTSATEPPAPASAASTSDEPPAPASADPSPPMAPSASAAAPESPTSAPAAPKGTAVRPKPTATAKPKEKWF